jgi:hypothetical protein
MALRAKSRYVNPKLEMPKVPKLPKMPKVNVFYLFYENRNSR